MMDHIILGANQSISSSARVENKVRSTSPLKTGSSDKDVFVRSANTEMPSEIKRTTKSLTSDAAQSLAEKYDVTNMTRNEFCQLLGELRNMGIIS